MSFDTDILPLSHLEDLVRAMVRAFRAYQMYLPNNPMYQRADEGLREAFAPVWEVVDEVVFLVEETRLVCESQVVYDQPSKSESFAWGLYKDGMRLLALKRGVEDEEITRFLQTVSRARLLPADASDDLLTLLWEQEFGMIQYRFAEVVSDPWVYDPQALALEAEAPSPAATSQIVRQAAQLDAGPTGVVDLEDFDSTLYFLDEVEIAELRRQVEDEYRRDLRGAAMTALFDIFELHQGPAVREEFFHVLETLFPNLLVRGDFRTVATVLRELRGLGERLKLPDEPVRDRLAAFETQLSEPATIAQLLQSLDEAAELPPEDDLGEVLRELRARALGAILAHLPRLASVRVRKVIETAAERLAAANTNEMVRLLRTLEPGALPGAIRLVGRLTLLTAVPPLGELVRHAVPEVRLAAVEVLGQMGTPGAMASLEPALDDTDRAVRSVALSAVSQRRYTGAVKRLEAAMLGKGPVDLERGEKRQVFEAYATIVGPAAVPVLRDLILPQSLFRRRPATDTRTCAVYALGRIRSAEARSVLVQAAGDKELPVRHAAASLLREWPE
ncbi:MAG TPA: HEAT repeat domain-containing protein [Gemmatimonadales bacterium]